MRAKRSLSQSETQGKMLNL